MAAVTVGVIGVRLSSRSRAEVDSLLAHIPALFDAFFGTALRDRVPDWQSRQTHLCALGGVTLSNATAVIVALDLHLVVNLNVRRAP